MAGRKQFDPDVALDAAIRVFWEKSYAAASINDLVTATGLSRGSLYNTFGDKHELFLACLTRYVDRVGAASRAALTASDSDICATIMASFEAILDRMADPQQPAGCLLAQTAAESGALPESVRSAVRHILEDQIGQMEAVLAPYDPGGAVDIRSLATYLVTTAQALAVMHRAGQPIEDLRTSAAHAMSALNVLAS